MKTTRFATAFIKADDLDRFERYLYAAHTIIFAHEYAYPDDGRKVALVVVQTEAAGCFDVKCLQQYQANRLASCMLPLIIGYETFQDACEYLWGQAKANNLSLLRPLL